MLFLGTSPSPCPPPGSRAAVAHHLGSVIFTVSPRIAAKAGPSVAVVSHAGCAAALLVVHHLRERKTGPQIPVTVVQCRTHRRAFTIYPLGHVPYGRLAGRRRDGTRPRCICAGIVAVWHSSLAGDAAGASISTTASGIEAKPTASTVGFALSGGRSAPGFTPRSRRRPPRLRPRALAAPPSDAVYASRLSP